MECCQERREGDQWSERKRITTPKVNYLKGFHIEIFFGYSGYYVTQCLGWYHWTVQEVVNEKKNHVIIKWGAECLVEHGVRVTDQKLALGNWNPKKVKKGGWRDYLTKKQSIFFSVIIQLSVLNKQYDVYYIKGQYLVIDMVFRCYNTA